MPKIDHSVPANRSADIPHMIGSARRYFDRAGETARDFGKFRLSVSKGPHAGAEIVCKAGTIIIGSASSNDLVLVASDCESEHVQLNLPSKLFASITITPLSGSVSLDDEHIVQVGEIAHASAETNIIVGDSEINLQRIGDPRRIARPLVRLGAVACLLAMIPVGYSLFSNMFVGVADAGTRIYSSIQQNVSSAANYTTGDTNAVKPENLEAFAWTVRTRLEDLKLNHRLRVIPTQDGSLRVQGRVGDGDVARWTAFLRWYDANPGLPPLVRDVQRTRADHDLPGIKSVWLDDKPTVFFKDGTSAMVGARVHDGWLVVGINADGVMLQRDGTTLSLTY